MLWVLLRGPFGGAGERAKFRRFVSLTRGYASVPTYGDITDSVTACVAIILTTVPPLSTAVLLKQLRPRQKLLHARFAKLFKALSRLLYGAFALGVAFRVELVGVTHHLLLHRFG